VLLWVHVVSVGLFVGATVELALAITRAVREGDPEARRARVVRVLRFYDPLSIALLGFVVMSGAWSVTSFKQSMGPRYFETFGHRLAGKLGLAFLVVMAGTYVCFGIGHRIVRQEDFGEPIEAQRLGGMLRRLRVAAWVTVGLTAWTAAFAAGLVG
jgi:hypothetical protein